ncbi:MAG: hypothetical protein NT145_08400 [Elusimicrobia bacterium]|nr:hypothetical protein [Elusimicrobiota bacterium]
MPSKVSEKEFAVINEISNNHLPDQRTIASRAGISLGMTNLIIKRLIGKGYIKVKQLDKRKIQYLLTPKGFAEKANKSYNFTLKTINLLTSVRAKIKELLENKHNGGCTDFVISGSGDLIDIIEFACKNLASKGLNYSIRHTVSDKENSTTIEYSEKSGKRSAIDLIHYLSETGLFYW